LFYQNLFDSAGDILSIMALPYPLYRDIMLAQLEEKKRLKKKMEESQRKK
jgi:hypothetical protein